PLLSGDFSLNAANLLSARALLDLGLERLHPGHDLNARHIEELAAGLGPGRIEATVYGHLPVFHTEHCVFCRFLSSGHDHTDCGHPCESHQVSLRDRSGQAHPVMADVGCRNTVFEGRAQTAARHLESWLAAGLRDLRLEFVHEDASQVRGVVEAFRAFFARPDPAGLEAALERAGGTGVTEGSLYVPADFPALPALTLA
ncbi:MAG: U32 family peptidase, partial [Deinococcus sp.]